MVVLFVHGMGRSPLSGWPLLRRLRQLGFTTQTFAYVAAIEDFNSIVARLRTRIEKLAQRGPYVVIGHSLGGVLLRAAINALGDATPQPTHLYLLGSPILASRIATKLKGNPVFRLVTGDSGQLLASSDRMQTISMAAVPTTCIAGTRGITHVRSPFGEEVNDGVVSISEVSAGGEATEVRVPVMHTLLPSSSMVANIIVQQLTRDAHSPKRNQR
jgi:pimeloyl-ACP methyl ester carboxylesterase